MRAHLFLPLILTLFSAASFAQREWHLEVDSSLRMKTLQGIRAVNVVDERKDTASIGYIKTGAFNRYAVLKIAGGFTSGLNNYLDFVTDKKAASGDQLILVIRHLLLQDRKKDEEIATIRIQADVFRGNDGLYRKYRTIDSFCELRSVWDVSSRMQKTACSMLVAMVQEGAAAKLESLSTDIYSTSQAREAQHNFRATLPAYSAGNMRRGIYRTYEDFLALRTSDTDFIDRRMVGGNLPPVIRIYLKDEKGKRGDEVPSAACYAVCDGKRWYYALKSSYRDMLWDGSDFSVNMNLTGAVDRTSSSMAAFGIIGAAIAASNARTAFGVVTYEVQLMPEDGEWHPVRRVVK